MTADKKVKLAIIEDDVAIVQMYRTKFELEGYEVATAGDGASGLELLTDMQPDVALLDLMMPNVSGIDLLESIQSQPELEDTKIIVLTNMEDTGTASRVYRLGITDYIVKADMTPEQVLEKVKQVLAGRSLKDQAA